MKKSAKGRRPKDKNQEHWGARLLAVLKEKNLSNRAAAKMISIAPSVLDAWIRLGSSPADLKLVKMLADKLDVDFCWLLTGERDTKKGTVSIAEVFQELPYFDGYARIRIDRLMPRARGNSDEE